MPLHLTIHNANTPDATLEIAIDGFDSILALKRNIKIRLADMTAIQCSPPEASEWFHFHSGLRVGCHMPGWVSKGTWYGMNGKCFYFFYKTPGAEGEVAEAASRVLGISVNTESHDAPFTRVVIEVPEGTNAGEWKNKLEEAKRIA